MWQQIFLFSLFTFHFIFVPLIFIESTFVRKKKEKLIFLLFFAHLFVPLQHR
jgi:hypothetical protein